MARMYVPNAWHYLLALLFYIGRILVTHFSFSSTFSISSVKLKDWKACPFVIMIFFFNFFFLYLIWFSHKFSFLSFAGKNQGNYVFVVCSAARGLINHILYESERLSGRKFSKSSWCCFRFFIFSYLGFHVSSEVLAVY